MNKSLRWTSLAIGIIALILLFVLFPESTKSQDATVKIHLRGVYESNISLLPSTGVNATDPLTVINGVKNGGTATIQVSGDNLPGEFVLRFDYKENAVSTPYPSEKRILISNQDLQLWVHPIYSNNSDSTWFQKDEKENTVYSLFLKENARQMQMLGLLQNFLLNYDDNKSTFYQDGIIEYEKRREACNQWIAEQAKQHKSLFVSSIFGFYKVPQINWKGSEADRKQNLRENYFEEMNFNDPQILNTTNMKEWMDGYVNLYGELATDIALRDSLFTLAGKNAIEEARQGDPMVYGWMVDYFFNGYESFNIEKGIKMLQPYLDDPKCLTSKRQAIDLRLKGIETLVPGTTAPDIIMQDADNKLFDLKAFQSGKSYLLLLFWSADCSHCAETVGKLYPFSQQAEVQKNLDIVAISVDETDTEVSAWQQKYRELNGWIHLRADEGINSIVARDYYILSVPVMILVNAKTWEIIAMPESADQLEELLSL
jgi:peroxiredoxin